MEPRRYTEDDLLPISALQHLAFCERQWALIHLERLWSDNKLTAEGRQMHEKTHSAGTERRAEVIIARGLRLRSLALGVWGVADVVEFRRVPEAESKLDGDAGQPIAAALQNVPGMWVPFLVEYKRGSPKHGNCDEIQLCAQAVCLEEMLNVSISESVLFYGIPRRRHNVRFTAALRSETASLALRLHELTEQGTTPRAFYGRRCARCSLQSLCMPKSAGRGKSAVGYLSRAIEQSLKEEV